MVRRGVCKPGFRFMGCCWGAFDWKGRDRCCDVGEAEDLCIHRARRCLSSGPQNPCHAVFLFPGCGLSGTGAEARQRAWRSAVHRRNPQNAVSCADGMDEDDAGRNVSLSLLFAFWEMNAFILARFLSVWVEVCRCLENPVVAQGTRARQWIGVEECKAALPPRRAGDPAP